MKAAWHILFILLGNYLFAQKPILSEWNMLVPSEALPPEVNVQKSNNNVDLTSFKGKYYAAFRTARTHFPTRSAVMYILSSRDLSKWVLEKTIALGADVREPRFCEYHDTLFFYFFEGGKTRFKFDPQHIWASHTTGKDWSQIKSINMDGFVPWRFRVHHDKIYLSAYFGKDLYKASHQGNLRLLTSTDGYNFLPVSIEPQVGRPGAEEGEFIFDQNGELWGTVRLESEGALIVHATKDSLSHWKTKLTPYKYDSALMFEHNGEIYLISRRNLDGPLNKSKKSGDEGWYWFRQKRNLIRYSVTKKTTALFKINKEKMELEWVMDLGGTGDTAFPAITKVSDNKYLVMNYSSDLSEGTKTWISGQLGKTFIYYGFLEFR